MQVSVRLEWSDEECQRLYRHHHAEWKKAEAERDALPWWALLRRSRADMRYRFHLNRAAIFGECLIQRK